MVSFIDVLRKSLAYHIAERGQNETSFGAESEVLTRDMLRRVRVGEREGTISWWSTVMSELDTTPAAFVRKGQELLIGPEQPEQEPIQKGEDVEMDKTFFEMLIRQSEEIGRLKARLEMLEGVHSPRLGGASSPTTK